MCLKDIMQRKRILRALEKAVGEMPELEDAIKCERKHIQELETQELKDAMAFVRETINAIFEKGDDGRRCLALINSHFEEENKDPKTISPGKLEGSYVSLRSDDYEKFEAEFRMREEKAAKK